MALISLSPSLSYADNTFSPENTEPAAGAAVPAKVNPGVTYFETYGPHLPLSKKPQPALFGSREILINEPSVFRKWDAMKTKFYKQLNEGRLPKRMQKLMFRMRALKGASMREKVKAANAYINTMTYRRDQDNWNTSDYWATPVEFFARGAGDCEDFAIAKYAFLRAIGVPDSSMRLAIVQDRLKRIPHAVLVVYTEEGAMILDNQSSRIMPSRLVRRYRPLLSLNNSAGWLHKI